MLYLVKWFLVVPAAVYLLILSVVYVLQRNLMYSPGHSIQLPADVGVPEMKIISARTDDGISITSWFAPPVEGKPTIILFHGNAGTLDGRAFKARYFMDAGYGVLLAGYRGFGENEGKPTEQGLYKDARAILHHHAESGDSGKKIVLYGESLGSGVAVQMAYELASKNDSDYQISVQGLILEAPFTSMGDAAAYHYPWLPARLLVKDRYDSINKIQSVDAPLLIIHGRRDRTIPFEMGEKIFLTALEPKSTVWLVDAGHVNVYDFGAGTHIVEWLDGL